MQQRLGIRLWYIPGDALLFMGCHGNTKIARGSRNVNLFTHKINIDWVKGGPAARERQTGGTAGAKKKRSQTRDGADAGAGQCLLKIVLVVGPPLI